MVAEQSFSLSHLLNALEALILAVPEGKVAEYRPTQTVELGGERGGGAEGLC